jgi:DNA-binding MarR family transcriptional regulator
MSKHSLPKPHLGELLLTFRRKIIESCRKEGLPSDLSMPEAEILWYIGPDGSSTMKAIAEHLKITPPSVTSMVREMENKGLVLRKADPSDRRLVSIVFSKKAKDLHESIIQKRNGVLEKMLSRISEKEKKELERIIAILIKE